MDFPPEFKKILEDDKLFLAALEQGNKVDGTQRRILRRSGGGAVAGGSFFDFEMEGAVNKKK